MNLFSYAPNDVSRFVTVSAPFRTDRANAQRFERALRETEKALLGDIFLLN